MRIIIENRNETQQSESVILRFNIEARNFIKIVLLWDSCDVKMPVKLPVARLLFEKRLSEWRNATTVNKFVSTKTLTRGSVLFIITRSGDRVVMRWIFASVHSYPRPRIIELEEKLKFRSKFRWFKCANEKQCSGYSTLLYLVRASTCKRTIRSNFDIWIVSTRWTIS